MSRSDVAILSLLVGVTAVALLSLLFDGVQALVGGITSPLSALGH
jgi:hypothetical protein